MSDLIFIAASVGLVFIIQYGSIFNKVRKYLTDASVLLSELLSCPQCLGFWCGTLLSLLRFLCFFQNQELYQILFISICWGFCISLIAPIVDMLMDIIGSLQEKLLDETEKIHEKRHKNNQTRL